MATTEPVTSQSQERTAQVRIHLRTKSDDLQLPDTGPILVSTGKLGVDVRCTADCYNIFTCRLN